MRGKETQVKRKINQRRNWNSHLYCLPQVQPFPTVLICSEMHPEDNMDVGDLLPLSVLLVNICMMKLQARIIGNLCPTAGKGSGLWLPQRAYVWSGSTKAPPYSCKQRFPQITHIPITGLHLSQSFTRIVFSAADVWAKPLAKFSGAMGTAQVTVAQEGPALMSTDTQSHLSSGPSGG